MLKLDNIRRLYIDYFIRHGHTEVKSSPLVPDNDPTLLFTVAGMVQFKDLLLGREVRDYKRAVDSQKCIRTNDLDSVGYDGRHHSFFEMLGNWSFGDYFKEEAIKMSWDFLINELKLPKEKLWFTVHPTDGESRGLWKKIAGVGDERVIDIEDNIWAAGPTGPRGFDTEIFYDQGESVAGGLPGTPEEDGDRYLEIWNNVFMEFERLEDGREIELKNKNVDTGMGLERITSVVQGAHSNYDTDLFLRIISDISEAVGAKPDAGNANSFRVISDHVRAAAFLIADGVTPSNEGRGYVLRRIIRRASRHVSILGMKKPALFKIAASVRDNMGAAYPELSERFGQVSATLRAEEESFASTLDAGLKILEEEAAKIGGGVMPGAAAFRLYDTYGFPLDMTVDILRGMGMSVDEKGFEAEMERQKERSRGAAEFKGEAGTAKVWYDLKARLGETEFIGYDTLASTSKAEAIVVGGEEKQSAPAGAEAWLVFRETPFYAEMGGQVADEGHIETGGAKHRVIDVQKFGGVTAHKVKAAAEIPAGAAAELRVDAAARARTASNHSAAHLLQYALRTVVGEHISQKGSRVWSGGFHFDFSNPRPALLEQIEEMERVANALIDEAATITMMPMPIEEAKKTGAIALFNEKYGDMVRVVKIGGKSVEFCGGTHCRSTAEVKFFHIISERSIAAGIRRIEAVAGDAALEYASSLGLDTSGSALDLCARLRDKLLSDRKRAEADAIAELERKKAEEAAATEREEKAVKAGAELSEINGVKIASFAGAVSSKNLKSIARSITGADVAAIVATTDGKASLVVFAPTGKISAVEAVRAVLSGAGGGNAEIAQGGMPAAQAEDAIANLKKYIQDNI